MKNRADLDHEIEQENKAIMHIERNFYRWSKPEDREARNEGIMEKHALGWSRDKIAAYYDLTPQRISAIINDFGAGWSHNGGQPGKPIRWRR